MCLPKGHTIAKYFLQFWFAIFVLAQNFYCIFFYRRKTLLRMRSRYFPRRLAISTARPVLRRTEATVIRGPRCSAGIRCAGTVCMRQRHHGWTAAYPAFRQIVHTLDTGPAGRRSPKEEKEKTTEVGESAEERIPGVGIHRWQAWRCESNTSAPETQETPADPFAVTHTALLLLKLRGMCCNCDTSRSFVFRFLQNWNENANREQPWSTCHFLKPSLTNA